MYTFNTTQNGNVEAFQNGQRIATGTAQMMTDKYGYTPGENPNKNYIGGQNNGATSTGSSTGTSTSTSNADNTGSTITDPNKPSSSSNYTTTNNANTAVTNVTATPEPLTDAQKEYMTYNPAATEDDVRNLWSTETRRQQASTVLNAGRTAADQKAAQAGEYEALKLKNDTAWQDMQEQINTHRQGALDAFAQQSGANMGQIQTSLSAAATTNINNLWDKTLIKAQGQYLAQQALLKSDNDKAAAQIGVDLQKTISDAQTQAANIINQQASRETAKETLLLNKQNIAADNFKQIFTTTNATVDEIDKMVKDGTIKDNPVYQSGIDAGFNAQGVIDMMKSGSIAQVNAKISALKAEQATENARNLQSYRDNMFALALAKLAGGEPNPELSKPENSIYYQAIKNAGIGASSPQRKEYENVLSSYLTTGNINGAKQYIARVAMEGYPAVDKTKIAGRVVLQDSLIALKDSLQQYVDKTGDTNILKGSVENAYNKVGQTTDPELAGIRNDINNVYVNYRSAMTGAQFSENESKEYKDIIPSITNSNTLNVAKIDSFLNTLERNQSSLIKNKVTPQIYDELFAKPITNGKELNNTFNEVDSALKDVFGETKKELTIGDSISSWLNNL